MKALADAGVSIWLDDLSRQRLTSGSLAALIHDKHVVGVTTNPTIFAKAISDADAYAEQVSRLAAEGISTDEAIRVITTDDVRDAADLFKPVYDDTDGQDGRVSIEVEPGLARDTEKTIRPGQGAVGGRRPGERLHQDPGHPGGPARRSPRRWPPGSA